jgi:hypothetical protein
MNSQAPIASDSQTLPSSTSNSPSQEQMPVAANNPSAIKSTNDTEEDEEHSPGNRVAATPSAVSRVPETTDNLVASHPPSHAEEEEQS